MLGCIRAERALALFHIVRRMGHTTKEMYDYLIYKQLKKYRGAVKSFHVPGHKARGEFAKKFPVAALDVTELSYSDNLQCPTGVIAAAQRDIAQILGAKRSYLLTDGSSSGVFTMLYAASRRGNKLIVPRNCHQSVWNACRLFGVEPVVVQGETVEGVLLPPAPERLERLLAGDTSISGIVVTSPDYYGNVAPLGAYAEIVGRYSRLLMVDGAHGSHLAFEPEKQGYAGVYADIWVDGAHKSLPTLTQGAVLSLNNESLISDVEEGLNMFRTTSPSYPVMASVEYGVKVLENNKKILEKAKLAAAEFVQSGAVPLRITDDWTKLAVDCKPLGISSDAAAKFLEKRGIYAELSDGRYLVFYLSPMVTAGDLNGLKNLLVRAARNKKLRGTYTQRPAIPAGERTYSYQYALRNPSEWVPLGEAVGRMSARNAGFAPPCIPVIVAGEIISAAQINVLKTAGGTFGVADGKIRVVKRQ